MRRRRLGFFRGYGQPEQLLSRYFEAGRWWNDIDHVMQLTPAELVQYCIQARRIAKLEARG